MNMRNRSLVFWGYCGLKPKIKTNMSTQELSLLYMNTVNSKLRVKTKGHSYLTCGNLKCYETFECPVLQMKYLMGCSSKQSPEPVWDHVSGLVSKKCLWLMKATARAGGVIISGLFIHPIPIFNTFQEHLEGIFKNLAPMSSQTQWWIDLVLVVKGHCNFIKHVFGHNLNEHSYCTTLQKC